MKHLQELKNAVKFVLRETRASRLTVVGEVEDALAKIKKYEEVETYLFTQKEE